MAASLVTITITERAIITIIIVVTLHRPSAKLFTYIEISPPGCYCHVGPDDSLLWALL